MASLARRIAKRYLGENLKPKKRGEREREREREGPWQGVKGDLRLERI